VQGFGFLSFQIFKIIKFNNLNLMVIDGTVFAIGIFVVFFVFHKRRN